MSSLWYAVKSSIHHLTVIFFLLKFHNFFFFSLSTHSLQPDYPRELKRELHFTTLAKCLDGNLSNGNVQSHDCPCHKQIWQELQPEKPTYDSDITNLEGATKPLEVRVMFDPEKRISKIYNKIGKKKKYIYIYVV